MRKKLYIFILAFFVSVEGFADGPEPPVVPPGDELPIDNFEWVLWVGALLLASYQLIHHIKQRKAPLNK